MIGADEGVISAASGSGVDLSVPLHLNASGEAPVYGRPGYPHQDIGNVIFYFINFIYPFITMF